VLFISPDIVSQAELVVVAGANMAGVKIVLSFIQIVYQFSF
jgi:hypothetical protein